MRQSTVASNEEKKNPELFGPYEVFERIGVGGMATVHRAKKQGIEGFERVVALKRMLSHLADDETFIQSFVREARLASQLQHGNIIHIYDLGRVGRVYYIAMEYVRGRDLRKILKQTAYATGPMPLAMMLMLAHQLCDALDYAHGLADEAGEPLGLVHRDVSPSNILIAADGHLKIIDFGIAKATSSSLRTLSGRVKGKFAYMAPEAIQGKQLDRRTDIFAVGIVAHEMLTARPLFATKNQFETIRKITQEEVKPPSFYNPECPPELDEIIMTALAKSPNERWQTAGAMHRALDHVAKKHGLQTTNREVAEWIEWAFQQPLQSKRIEPAVKTAVEQPQAKEPTLKSGPVVPMENLDSASIELVWGGQQVGRSQRGSGSVNGDALDSSPGPDDGRSSQSPGEPASSGQQGVPVAMGGPASDGSQPHARLSSSDSSQPHARLPSGDSSQPHARIAALHGSGQIVASMAGADSRSMQRPTDPRQAAGQSTMLGVAPPPGQGWRPPKGGDSGLLGAPPPASAPPPSQPTSVLPPSPVLSSPRPVQRHAPDQRHAPTLPRPTLEAPRSPLRTALQIALVLVLCAGAAVGGYFIVLAIFGG